MSYYAKKIDKKVIELLNNGGVGLLPTDTIYGLSAVALNKDAVEKIHKLKERSSHKPFIVLISDINQLELLGIGIEQAEAVKKYWPAPLSVIFASANVPQWLQLGTLSLAVRLPDDSELRSLIKKVGPLISTSANLQGQKPAGSAQEAEKFFDGEIDFYVNKGELNNSPSTLVKVENGKLKIIRQGKFNLNLE